jgi:hypothetical protein
VTSRRADACALAFLVLVGTLIFADVLFGFNQFYMRDLTRYYYPAKQILREIVQHGEFPYWNRYFSGGQPIAANPEHEVFYPLTWLILLPSYDLGYRLLIILHVWIGLAAMYALLRSMEITPFAATAGALAFGIGGLYLSYVNLLPILFCAAWLPLTCLFVRRFLLRRNAHDFAAGALFLGLQFLVAEPTTVMQTGLLLGFYALYRGWYSRPRITKMLGKVAWVGLISLCGLLVGAAQFLPALDHVRDSARSRPFEFDLVSCWSMPWAKFAELVYPNILGHISIKQVMWYWGGGLYPGMGSPFLFSIYTSLLILALAIGAAFARPRGGRFVLLLFAVSSLLALGGHTPLLRWMYDAGFAAIRYPEKFILMGIFALIIFATQMLDRIRAGDEAAREGALGFAVAATVIAGVFALITFFPMYSRLFMKVWGQTPSPQARRMVSLSQADWIIATARGLMLIVILATARVRQQRAWMAGVIAYLTFDLAYVTRELNPTMPRRFFNPPPAAATLLPNHADYRVFHEADWYGTEEPAKQYFSTGDAVYWVVRNGLFPMTPAGSQVRTVMERDYDKTNLLPAVDLTESVWDVKRSGRGDWYEPFLGMSNAWYRGVYRDFAPEKKRNRGNFKSSLPIRFVEGTHYPRYYFADQLVTIKDRHDFVDKLINNSFSRAVAFVPQPSFVPARGIVRKVAETNNSARMDVESFGQGFLVMSVTPHKYWSITVDGARVPAVVTNIAYQGIVMTPGRHVVVMRYRNELVVLGLWLSIGSIVILSIILLFVRRRPDDLLAADDAHAAYEEPVHVVADADGGTHVEPAVIEAEPPAEPLPAETLPADDEPFIPPS